MLFVPVHHQPLPTAALPSHIGNNSVCKLISATSELFSERRLQNALCRASPTAVSIAVLMRQSLKRCDMSWHNLVLAWNHAEDVALSTSYNIYLHVNNL